MKLSAVLAAVFSAGILASLAIAKPPPGHGGRPHGRDAGTALVTTTGTSTDTADTTSTDGTTTDDSTTTTTPERHRVVLCHRTRSRSNPWVRIVVPARLALRRIARGDVPPVGGHCPAPRRHPGGDGDGTGTTTAETTTAETTTAVATTTAP